MRDRSSETLHGRALARSPHPSVNILTEVEREPAHVSGDRSTVRVPPYCLPSRPCAASPYTASRGRVDLPTLHRAKVGFRRGVPAGTRRANRTSSLGVACGRRGQRADPARRGEHRASRRRRCARRFGQGRVSRFGLPGGDRALAARIRRVILRHLGLLPYASRGPPLQEPVNTSPSLAPRREPIYNIKPSNQAR